ncbi:MAG: NUDIX hydrolase [Thermotaleaceae bacterium]
MSNFIGVGGLLCKEDKYLLVRHTYGEYNGQWILPGGHVKPGEHIDNGIIREFKEETDLDVKPLGILSIRSRIRQVDCTDCYIVFLLDYVSGCAKSDNYENDSVQFFTIEEINHMDNIISLSKIIINTYHQEKYSCLSASQVHEPYLPDNKILKLFL